MDQMPAIKELIREELRKKFRGFDLPPESKNVDLRESRKIAPRLASIPQVDTLVLFSASQRANKGRKRYKHSGQTSSIYLSDRLGGKQVGTLTHIFSWKNGPLLLDSIPDQKASTIGPLIDECLPKNVPLFSDEGFRLSPTPTGIIE